MKDTGKYDLSAQETFLMQLFWSEAREMTLGEVDFFAKESGFKPSIGTVKTYLQRLVKKGALSTRKVGHKLLYIPVSEEVYRKKFSESFLNDHFNGSLPAFIAALTGNVQLSESEIEELKKYQ